MTTDNTQAELREAVRDGLANHTGEFINPWIVSGRYTHEELTTLLEDIMSSERLFKKLLDWHNKQVEAELEALLEEIKHEDLRTISQVITARIDKLKEVK